MNTYSYTLRAYQVKQHNAEQEEDEYNCELFVLHVRDNKQQKKKVEKLIFYKKLKNVSCECE